MILKLEIYTAVIEIGTIFPSKLLGYYWPKDLLNNEYGFCDRYDVNQFHLT